MTRQFYKLILKTPFKKHEFTRDQFSHSYIGYENICKLYVENNVIKIKHGGDGDNIPTFTYLFVPVKYLKDELLFKPYLHCETDCLVLKGLRFDDIYIIIEELGQRLFDVFTKRNYEILEQSESYNTLSNFQKYLFETIFSTLFENIGLDSIYEICEDEFITNVITNKMEYEMDLMASNLALYCDNTNTYIKNNGWLKVKLIEEYNN